MVYTPNVLGQTAIRKKVFKQNKSFKHRLLNYLTLFGKQAGAPPWRNWSEIDLTS